MPSRVRGSTSPAASPTSIQPAPGSPTSAAAEADARDGPAYSVRGARRVRCRPRRSTPRLRAQIARAAPLGRWRARSRPPGDWGAETTRCSQAAPADRPRSHRWRAECRARSSRPRSRVSARRNGRARRLPDQAVGSVGAKERSRQRTSLSRADAPGAVGARDVDDSSRRRVLRAAPVGGREQCGVENRTARHDERARGSGRGRQRADDRGPTDADAPVAVIKEARPA